MFSRSLGVPLASVTTESDFFALGGDSLAIAELLTTVEQEAGTAVELDLLLAGPTPHGIASAVGPAPGGVR